MYKRHYLGKFGEEVAERFLKQKGFNIIERNFTCKQGEIDIIATNNEYIVFIEVKTRSNFFYGRPIEAVSENKQNHMYKVARYYLYIHGWEKKYVRFDAVEVFIDKGIAKVNHIPQIM